MHNGCVGGALCCLIERSRVFLVKIFVVFGGVLFVAFFAGCEMATKESKIELYVKVNLIIFCIILRSKCL